MKKSIGLVLLLILSSCVHVTQEVKQATDVKVSQGQTTSPTTPSSPAPSATSNINLTGKWVSNYEGLNGFGLISDCTITLNITQDGASLKAIGVNDCFLPFECHTGTLNDKQIKFSCLAGDGVSYSTFEGVLINENKFSGVVKDNYGQTTSLEFIRQ